MSFPDARSLWTFVQNLQAEFIQVNSKELKLICDCSENDVSKALMQFNAQIVDEVEERNVGNK